MRSVKRSRPIPAHAIITVTRSNNPKRDGTQAHRIWTLYRNGGTVGQFLAAGANRWPDINRRRLINDLNHAVDNGFILVSIPFKRD